MMNKRSRWGSLWPYGYILSNQGRGQCFILNICGKAKQDFVDVHLKAKVKLVILEVGSGLQSKDIIKSKKKHLMCSRNCSSEQIDFYLLPYFLPYHKCFPWNGTFWKKNLNMSFTHDASLANFINFGKVVFERKVLKKILNIGRNVIKQLISSLWFR